jgi:hypothetical protein
LKAFQRDTVDFVYHRMYEADPPARRFLIADEVGLGKTLVAKGLLARVIDHLWDDVGRIDIVYICSNSGIARQNISRLNISGHTDHRLPDRITLLPRSLSSLRHRKLNFISFTPGTSFNLRSRLGVADERALLYWLIPDDWKADDHGAISVLTGAAARRGFKARVGEFQRSYTVDEELRQEFQKRLAVTEDRMTKLKSRFIALCEAVARREDLDDQERAERTGVIGELRELLAHVCINALEPDLIILDEFQRFKDLLYGDSFAADLARALFTYESLDRSEQARVLLLSATPYKMYTLHDETGGDDHFKDFLETVRFLHQNEARTEKFRGDLENYRRALFRYRTLDGGELRKAKEAVEAALREVMVRTERLAVTADRNGMLAEVPSTPLNVEANDLTQYLALQRVARIVDHPDTMEFWKSAPYALNFMDEYNLKKELRSTADSSRSPLLFEALASAPGAILSQADLEAYRRLDPGNVRLRWLLHSTIEAGGAELFWVPPSSPYYRLEGPFAAAARFTKRLIFSAWQVVPKVVAALLSFEAERQLLGVPDEGQPGANSEATRRQRRGLLRYTLSEGRLTGMPVLGLVYPSATLALLGDPLQAASQLSSPGMDPPQLEDVIGWVRQKISTALSDMSVPAIEGAAVDQRWYWAAPILLDLTRDEEATREWFGQADLATLWQRHVAEGPAAEEEAEPAAEDRWAAHVEEARRLLRDALELPLGNPPDDLAEVLGWMAVGGFANNALRALTRVSGGVRTATYRPVRNAAGQIAGALRSLFNQPEVNGSIRRADAAEPYWRRALEYSARGCLSAVLDEYAHVAFEAESLSGKSVEDTVRAIAQRMITALTLQTATLRVDMVTLDRDTRAVAVGNPFGFRTSFAVRYGARGDEGQAADRNQRLQIAFNSPFWPFVLCTTSVGQEGLDFHSYCHAVVHWNLPSNPVDLEQREGRVHRYKGHAVRKNVAARHADAMFGANGSADPWVLMFREARKSVQGDDSDLIPYWVYSVEDGARIERHVPALPLSQDAARKEALQRSLAVYRMAFGQSRQEDLVVFLQQNIPSDRRDQVVSELMINLFPPRSHRVRP